MTRLHLISPARNESSNLVDLLQNLNSQTENPYQITWTIVVNNSSDDTFEIASGLVSEKMQINVLSLDKVGDLFSAAEYEAFWFAINTSTGGEFNYTMKLDCDVRLEKDYFNKLSFNINGREGLFGGLNTSPGEQVQMDSRLVRGATSCYSSGALTAVGRGIPICLGYDVMDKVLLTQEGFECELFRDVKYQVERKTSSSEGILRGRYRNGVVCRITGYSKVYFFLHLIRYTLKTPVVVGGLCMLMGYLMAPKSPFRDDLLNLHREYQRGKLQLLMRSPTKWIKSMYLER